MEYLKSDKIMFDFLKKKPQSEHKRWKREIQSHRNPRHPRAKKLVIPPTAEDDTTFTIQTQQMVMQVDFEGPVKELNNYFLKYEQFQLRAALSTLPIHVDQFDTFYNGIKVRAKQKYEKYMHKNVALIKDLLQSAEQIRLDEYRKETLLINNFRGLLMKDLDPYEFNPTQFTDDYLLLNLYLAEHNLALFPEDKQLRMNDIRQATDRIKTHEAQRMKDMYDAQVKNPYRAQVFSEIDDLDYIQINAGKLYKSFRKELLAKEDELADALDRKYMAIKNNLVHFLMGSLNMLKTVMKGSNKLIHEYMRRLNNEDLYRRKELTDRQLEIKGIKSVEAYVHDIVLPVFTERSKRVLNADDINVSWLLSSESKPCLTNHKVPVRFKNWVRVIDEDNHQDQLVEMTPNFNEFKQDYYMKDNVTLHTFCDPNNFFTPRLKRNLDREYVRNRERQELLYDKKFQLKGRRDDLKPIHTRILKLHTMPPDWELITRKDTIFCYCNVEVLEIQKVFETPFCVPTGNLDYNHCRKYDYRTSSSGRQYGIENASTTELVSEYDRNKREREIAAQEKGIQEYDDKNRHYRKIRREEEFRRRNKIRNLIAQRDYQEFAKLSKLSPEFRFEEEKIFRYGIQLKRQLDTNASKVLEEFIFYYYKEKYFQEHQQVKTNADNPVMMNNMEPQKLLQVKAINLLVKNIKKLNRLVLWAKDIYLFEVKTHPIRGPMGYFTAIIFTHPANVHKMLYELKRRISMDIIEVIEDARDIEATFLNNVYRKIECFDRNMYDRHLKPFTQEDRVDQGKFIVNEILDEMNPKSQKAK